ARYHSYKIEAGIRLAAYFATGDGSGLAGARRLMSEATSCWTQIVALSENVYYDDMVTGPSNAGSWKKRLPLVYEDELRLAEIEALHMRYGLFEKGFDFGPQIDMHGLENGRFDIMGSFSVEKGFLGVDAATCYDATDTSGASGASGASTGYGWTQQGAQETQGDGSLAKQGDGSLASSNMKQENRPPVSGAAMAYPRLTDKSTDAIWRRDAIYEQPFTVSRGYRSPLYEDYLSGSGRAEFVCDLDDGDYFVTLVFYDMSVSAKPHGPFNVYVNGQTAVAGLRTAPFERVEKTVEAHIANGKMTVAFESLPQSSQEDGRRGDDSRHGDDSRCTDDNRCADDSRCTDGSPCTDDSRCIDWFISAILIKTAAPSIAHMPPRSFYTGSKSATINATVTAPSGAPDKVTLEFNGHSLAMDHTSGGHYSADVAHLLGAAGTASYKIIASCAGLQTESAEYRVAVCNNFEGFTARHTPPAAIASGADFQVTVDAAPQQHIKEVNLWYSQTNQYADMVKATMAPTGGGAYKAAIPADYIVSNRGILYYFEVIGHDNNGAILPDFREQTPYYIVDVTG
ncbi:MAG: hypothetical protein FWH01_08010, partial [Oscillospiraceae bacterium]|nr:hypothetical protein [Oscillospiraceae bacterium]